MYQRVFITACRPEIRGREVDYLANNYKNRAKIQFYPKKVDKGIKKSFEFKPTLF